jgi:hypothetical protein
MMATTLRQRESLPAEYPAVFGLSAAAAALNAAMLWQRIEAYTAFRFTPRDVQWLVEGPGLWLPPLAPVVIEKAERFAGRTDWQDVTTELEGSAGGGFWLPGDGPYRFSGLVGGDDYYVETVPPLVLEAYRRLAEYIAAANRTPAGIRSIAHGAMSISFGLSGSSLAAAMQNSGAADSLRGYRRAT